MVTTKTSQSYFKCVKLFIHKISCSCSLFRRKYSRLVIVELCIYHFWRHTIYCSSVFAKLLKKQRFSVIFSHKIVQSQSLKLNISRMAWPILINLVSFCRSLNGLSDEINLFWRCSSPLISYFTKILIKIMHDLGHETCHRFLHDLTKDLDQDLVMIMVKISALFMVIYRNRMFELRS